MLVVEVVVPKWRGAPSTRTMQSRATRRGTKRWPDRRRARRRASAARDRRAASSVTRRARTVAPATRVCPSAARAARRPMAQAAAAAPDGRPRIGHQRLNHVTAVRDAAPVASPGSSPVSDSQRALLPQLHVARTIRLATLETRPRHSALMPHSTASVAASRAAQRRRAHAARHVRRGAGSAGRTRREPLPAARSAPRRSEPSWRLGRNLKYVVT